MKNIGRLFSGIRGMGLFLLVSVFSCLLFDCSLSAEQALRGPYLQSMSENSVVVRWRTDEPTTSILRYGTSPWDLNLKASSPGFHNDHVVLVRGLSPKTRYYYSVGTQEKALAGGDGKHSWTTAPAVGERSATRVWIIGDSGTGNENARAVYSAFRDWTGRRGADVWLMLGDNAYNTGTDSEYQKAVFDTYPEMLRNVPVWPTLGNHDGASANSATQSGVYYDIFTLPTQAQSGGMPSGTEAYYSFDHGRVHFICLDSHDTNRDPNGAMANWLRADLNDTNADWLITFFHHPPYTKGSHDSDNPKDSAARMVEMRENILPILEAGGVDMVFTGHSHSYERSFLVHGHYGYSPSLEKSMILDSGDGRPDGSGAYSKASTGSQPQKAGTVYVVAGSSGKISGGALDHPVNYSSLNELGSVALDIDGSILKAKFINNEGGIRDWFEIRK